MLTFYKDALLTIPVTPENPVSLLSPTKGITKTFSLWLADTYAVTVVSDAHPGDSVLRLSNTGALPAAGTLSVSGITVSYTGKSEDAVIGIPVSGTGSIGVNILQGANVYPVLTYTGATGLIISSASTSVSISLRPAGAARYGIPGAPALFSFQTGSSRNGDYSAVLAQVDVMVTVPAGDAVELTDWSIVTSQFSIPELGITDCVALANGHAYRGAETLDQMFRVLVTGRQIPDTLPGFEWGSYRWRDQNSVNEHAVMPTTWDLDVVKIGLEKFISGIGDGADLQVLDVEKSQDPQTPHSIYPRINRGTYFVGPDRYYLPSDAGALEIFPVSGDGQILNLKQAPKSQVPVFVGNYNIDYQQEYRSATAYQYQATGFDAQGPTFQYTVRRGQGQITLNKAFTLPTLFVGTAPAGSSGIFNIPVFPVGQILRVFLGAYGSYLEETVTSWSYEPVTGQLTIAFPSDAPGRDIYVDATPAVAVVYEAAADTATDALLTSADLNPAFAGIANGYLFLDHRRRRVQAIQLFADKPRIVTPQSYALVDNLISFGPVFYENDYAMLLAYASGCSSDEAVPNAKLQVTVTSDFEGSIGYKNPLTQKVILTTGGDGTATFLYLPPQVYGWYLDTSSVSGATLSLAASVAIQQFWNQDDGWLVRLYQVFNNDGFFGKVGADPTVGEIAWATNNQPGTPGYLTNGKRSLWTNQGKPVFPSQALDSQGHNYTDQAFSGFVSRLVFPAALPQSSTIGSYFLAYVGRVTLDVMSVDTGVVSNSILLSLATPPEINDNSGVSGYLRPNDRNVGRLNINRLGGALVLPSLVNVPRY